MGLALGPEESWQSRAYEDYILDLASGNCIMRYGHHKLCSVQSKYVAKMVDSKKNLSPVNIVTARSPTRSEIV
ncbi:UNVERIFIED_CONTAM: hypothetical protein Slati_4208500 [Sesamum latifolium]|uniref:Uncharacterized protein n=1 Tax=Sesamum latifolium TaxID=2727402 RepID=A0AAW2TDK4_9LAMI